jgi:hypothetical protein
VAASRGRAVAPWCHVRAVRAVPAEVIACEDGICPLGDPDEEPAAR